jgi:hypothetical protein
MTKYESSIERRACELIYRYLGIVGIKLTPQGRTGYPDRMFLLPEGSPLFIEFKREGETLRPKQEIIIKTMKELGYNVQIHTTARGAFGAVIGALDPEKLSKRGVRLLNDAQKGWASLAPECGKDIHNANRREGAKGKGACK